MIAETNRLYLREMTTADAESVYELNLDHDVMVLYFSSLGIIANAKNGLKKLHEVYWRVGIKKAEHFCPA